MGPTQFFWSLQIARIATLAGKVKLCRAELDLWMLRAVRGVSVNSHGDPVPSSARYQRLPP